MKLAHIQPDSLCWNGIDLHWAYSTLLTSLTRKTRCKYQANDILHDGLLRFALSPNPNRHLNANAYLQTIVQNLILENFRKHTHVLAYQSTFEHADATTASAEYLADIKQRLELLTQIIHNLPVRCREVFILFRIDGVSQKTLQ